MMPFEDPALAQAASNRVDPQALPLSNQRAQ